MKKNFFWFTQAPGFLLFPIRVFAAIILGITAGGNSNQTELLACQVETATSICTEGLAAWESLRKYRCELARTVVEAGLMAVGLGALPKHPAEPAVVAENERYRKIQRFVPGISADQYVSGLHIHVGIPAPEAGAEAPLDQGHIGWAA